MFNLSSRLKELRLSKNLTQKQLAALIGGNERSIRFYESGERLPGIDVVVALCNVFDVTTDYLIGLKDC